MRFAFASVLFCFASFAASAACGGDDGGEEAFDTYQECFDDHHGGAEALGVQESIVVCCLEHPIAGHTEVCGSTTADCMTYLATNLSSASATATEISAACTDYVAQKGM
jgi:hypothetical protein